MNIIVTPEYILKEVETCIYDFLWKGKKDKIKRACMINDFSKGGIRDTDLDLNLQLLKQVGSKDLLMKTLSDGNLFHVAISISLVKITYFSKWTLIKNANFHTQTMVKFYYFIKK